MLYLFIIVHNMTFSRSIWEINKENVITTLQRAGGRLESRLIVGQFLSGVKTEEKCNPKSLQCLCEVLDGVANKKYSSDRKPVWVLKDEFK